MNKSYLTAILAVFSLASGAGAMAHGISKSEYKAAEKNIGAEYKSAKANCASLAGNAKDICIAEAKGKENVAKAELKARYKPSRQSDYDVAVAKAQADYLVAKEKCGDRAGKAKGLCVKEAKTALKRARSDAKEQLFLSLRSGIKAKERANLVAREQVKTSGAGTTTSEEPPAERMKAKE